MLGSLSLKSNLLNSPFVEEALWEAALPGLLLLRWDGPVKGAEAEGGAQDPDAGRCCRHTSAIKSWPPGCGDRGLRQGVEFPPQYLR